MGDLRQDLSLATEVAEIIKALSHPHRLMIVAHLRESEANVSELTAKLGLPQSLVSQQLRILRMAGLVAFSRKSGFAVYRLAQPHLVELLHCLEGCCSGDN